MNKNKNLISFIILIVAFLVSFYFYQSNTKNDTLPSNLKNTSETENKKLNFKSPIVESKVEVEIEELTAEQKAELALDEKIKAIEKAELDYKNKDNTDSEKLMSLIKSNDLCSLHQLKFSQEDMALALLNVESPITTSTPLLDKLVKSQSSLLNLSRANSETDDEVLKYINAMTIAGYILGNDNEGLTPKEDFEKSNNLLTELKESYPNNGLYPFVRAQILSELGYSENLVRAEFIEAFEKAEFNTHITKLRQEVFEKLLTNPAYFTLGYKFLNRMLYPNLLKAIPTLSKLIKQKDEVFNEKAKTFALRLADVKKVPTNAIIQHDITTYNVGYMMLTSLQRLQDRFSELKSHPRFYEIYETDTSEEKKLLLDMHQTLEGFCKSPNINKMVENLNLLKKQYSSVKEKNKAFFEH